MILILLNPPLSWLPHLTANQRVPGSPRYLSGGGGAKSGSFEPDFFCIYQNSFELLNVKYDLSPGHQLFQSQNKLSSVRILPVNNQMAVLTPCLLHLRFSSIQKIPAEVKIYWHPLFPTLIVR